PWSFGRRASATPSRSRLSEATDRLLSALLKTCAPGSGRRPLAGAGAAGQSLPRARASAGGFREPREKRWLFCSFLFRPSRCLSGKFAERHLHRIMGHAIDFSFSNEAAPDGFLHRLLQLAPVHMPRPQQIDDRLQRTCDPHAVYFLHVARVEIRPVQDENFRNLARPAKRLRYRHVQFRWHEIGKLVQTERRVVAVGSFRNFPPVLRPEIPEHQVRTLGRRKVREPVDPPVLANPVSRLHVVGVGLLREPRPDGLLRREESLLRLSYFVKPALGFFP